MKALPWNENILIALHTCNGIGIIAIVVTAYMLYVYRNNRSVKASSVKMMWVNLVGCGIISLSLSLMTLIPCQSYVSAVIIGITLIVIPVVVKLYRIIAIFDSLSFVVNTRMTDAQLFLRYIFPSIGLTIIACVTWIAAAALTDNLIDVNTDKCPWSGNLIDNIFFLILISWIIFIVLLSLRFDLRVRGSTASLRFVEQYWVVLIGIMIENVRIN